MRIGLHQGLPQGLGDAVPFGPLRRETARGCDDAVIAGDAPLGSEWLDHPLKGEWSDHRECHVGGDFLLVYHAERDRVVFVRAGTHADLFEE